MWLKPFGLKQRFKVIVPKWYRAHLLVMILPQHALATAPLCVADDPRRPCEAGNVTCFSRSKRRKFRNRCVAVRNVLCATEALKAQLASFQIPSWPVADVGAFDIMLAKLNGLEILLAQLVL